MCWWLVGTLFGQPQRTKARITLIKNHDLLEKRHKIVHMVERSRRYGRRYEWIM
jgi:hypothetical protein